MKIEDRRARYGGVRELREVAGGGGAGVIHHLNLVFAQLYEEQPSILGRGLIHNQEFEAVDPKRQARLDRVYQQHGRERHVTSLGC